MPTFAIADTHLSFSADKSMELFGGSWSGYAEKLRENWNKAVGPDDRVVIAGDISWGASFDEALRDFAFINHELNGEKYIIKGNHDHWWSTMSKMAAWLESSGFDKIRILHNNAYLLGDIIACGTRGWFEGEDGEPPAEEAHNKKILSREVGRLAASVSAAKKIKAEHPGAEICAFLHYPPIYGGYSCGEIIALLKSEGIGRCFFGHVHGAREALIKRQCGGVEFALISSDYLSFSPLRIKARRGSSPPS